MGEKKEEAFAGQRVAVNLTGIEKEYVERGSWLAAPGALVDNKRVDIRLELLDDAPEMTQRTRVHVHHGTTEALARVKLLGCDKLAGGGSCFAQLELEEPLAALPGDRFVLRFYSPMFTIGGGTVLDPSAVRHRKRKLDEGLSLLEALHSGDWRQIVLASIARDGIPWQLADIKSCLQISTEEAEALLQEMTSSTALLQLEDGAYLPAEFVGVLCDSLEKWLDSYFVRWPMRSGAPKKEAAQAVFPKMDTKQQRAFFLHLSETGRFSQDDKLIWITGHESILNDEQKSAINALIEIYGSSGFSPPTWPEVVEKVKLPAKEQGEYMQWLLRDGELVRTSDDMLYARGALEEAESMLRKGYPDGFTLGEARDLMGTSRKEAQLICDYFDSKKLTNRDGEKRFWL